jgi:hypothetical protein
MPYDPKIEEILVFEVPDVRLAADLVAWLSERWPCCALVEPIGTVVGVLTPDGAGELAELLRRVEAWVGETSIGEMRFWLDGRAYFIEAGDSFHPTEMKTKT